MASNKVMITLLNSLLDGIFWTWKLRHEKHEMKFSEKIYIHKFILQPFIQLLHIYIYISHVYTHKYDYINIFYLYDDRWE